HAAAGAEPLVVEVTPRVGAQRRLDEVRRPRMLADLEDLGDRKALAEHPSLDRDLVGGRLPDPQVGALAAVDGNSRSADTDERELPTSDLDPLREPVHRRSLEQERGQ